MAKFASTLGPLNVPQSRRGIASYDASVVGRGMLNAAQDIKGAGRDLSRGLNALAVRAEEVAQEDDRRYAQELDNEFAKRITEVQYGDGTEHNPGYYNLKGENAVKGYAGQEAKIESIKQEILSKAQNQRVKNMFGLAADQRQNTEIEGMRKHVGTARVDAADAVTATRQKQAENDAALAPGNQVILDRSMAIAERGAYEYGMRHGQSKEEIALAQAGMRSNVLVAAINAALPVDADAADAIYQRNKDKIDPQARSKIENVLLEQTIDAKAQSIAEDAQANGGKTMASQLQYIRDNYSGKKEEAAVAELKERFSEADYAADQAHQALTRARSNIQWEWAQAEHNEKVARDSAKKGAWEAVTNAENPISLSQWAAKNPEEFNALDAYDWGKLQSAETNFLTQQEYGDVTDPAFLADLHKMEPGDLMKMDLYLDKKKFKNQADYEKALHMQKAAEDRINRESNNASTYRRMEYMLKDYAPKDSKGKLALNDDQLNTVQNEAAAEVYAYIQQKGEAPDDKWLREQANRMMTPVWRDRSWYNLSNDSLETVLGASGKLAQDDMGNVYIPKEHIDEPTLLNIQNDLKAAGIAEDDVLIGKLALAAKRKDQATYTKLITGAK
jgi:hypothetical protein